VAHPSGPDSGSASHLIKVPPEAVTRPRIDGPAWENETVCPLQDWLGGVCQVQQRLISPFDNLPGPREFCEVFHMDECDLREHTLFLTLAWILIGSEAFLECSSIAAPVRASITPNAGPPRHQLKKDISEARRNFADVISEKLQSRQALHVHGLSAFTPCQASRGCVCTGIVTPS
jgi:hypothetical protein